MSISAPYTNIWRACELAAPAYLHTLHTLVNQDSGTHDMPELRTKAEMIARLFRETENEAGRKAILSVTLRETMQGEGQSKGPPVVLATLRGTGTGRVLLLAHYDTVWPRGTAQKRPLRIQVNRAYGPGVADAQHSVAAMVVLANILRVIPESYAIVTCLCNGDEERGSPTSKKNILEQAAQHDVVFSMESGGIHGESVITATSTTRPDMLVSRGRIPFEAPPATQALANKARDIFAEIGRPLNFVRFGVLTDANYACQKAPTLEGLGMGGGKWHTPEEFLDLTHIPARLYLLVRLVQDGPKVVRNL